ncbi:MAG: hypothetical protein ACKVS6_16895 [Planctomycetota bacterium]
MSSPQNNINKTPLAVSIATGLAVAAVAAGALIIILRSAALETIPIDGCYYLPKAESLAETGKLRVPWGTGIDTKFFPGLSILFAPFIKFFGLRFGWIPVEVFCYIGAAWLVALTARRIGAGAIGASAAAIAFATDPLIIKWASVPYAEIPAAFFTLASIEFTFRARSLPNRFPAELLASLALGVAGMMRVEAFIALPVLLAIAFSGRAAGRGVLSAISIFAIAMLPIAAHVSVMAGLDVAPSRLHYVEEFIRNFSWDKYQTNLFTFLQELAHVVPSSKMSLIADFPGWLSIAYAAARIAVAILGAAGIVILLMGRARVAAAIAFSLLLLFTFGHALWHYGDARFLVIMWIVPCAAAGATVEVLFEKMKIAGGALAAAVFIILLIAGNGVARAHAGEWERTTRGSARELAARIDTLVSPAAEGLYQFDEMYKPRAAAGPFVAMWRKAPARFCYRLDNFFEADTEPSAAPSLLKSGNRFVITNLRFGDWLNRYIENPAERAAYRAVIEEPGRTVIVYNER